MRLLIVFLFSANTSLLFAQNDSLSALDSIAIYGSGPEFPYCWSNDSTVFTWTPCDASRKIVTPPTFSEPVIEDGKIVLDIWVNEKGDVIMLRYNEDKSTSGSEHLIRQAMQAAKTMKYAPKVGVTKEYVGYQIFMFKKTE